MGTKYEDWDELQYRKFLVALLKEQGCHVSIVESHETSPGIPDLNVSVMGREFWVELKVKGGQLRPSQKRWVKERLQVDTNVYVIVFDAGMMLVLNAADIDLKEDLEFSFHLAHTIVPIEQLSWRAILK